MLLYIIVGINIQKEEMKKEEIIKMRLEELQKKVKTYKTLTGVLIGLVLVMFVVVFIPNSSEDSFALKLLPISFLPLVIINIITTRKLAAELKSRE